jgi:selenocysteine-specific elongation factor
MKRVILGTAGHIDHGKTELVKALTGIDTDRLKEEKQRGISIELGFAFLDLGPDVRMGVIDVPGHEKFVRQMVAGSGGIDLAGLVVALDEGVMPQTVEHLDILCLLGVDKGIVVLTKADLVDDELAMLAEEDVLDLVKGTFLESAPMVKVSSRTGEGIETLRSLLTGLAKQTADKPVHGLFRLPVDRVFTLKGHGTIVTGTLISGSISVGDEVEILPRGIRSSVRSLESHNKSEEKAFPGERVAVNLRGLEQTEVKRGDMITHPGEFKPSFILDVRLRALPRSSIPLTNRRKVKLHHYTSEVEALVVLPDMEVLEPGKESVAQIRSLEPIAASTGDRFVIRALSPSITLGGGVIINPRGVKLKARSTKSFLETSHGDESSIVASLIRSGGPSGISKKELVGLSGLSNNKLDKVLEKLRNGKIIIRFDAVENRMIHKDFYAVVRKKLLDKLQAFHAANPTKDGMSKQELRSTLPGDDKLYRHILDELMSLNQVIVKGDTARASSHEVHLKSDEEDVKQRLLRMISEGRNAPPILKELITASNADVKTVRNLLNLLEREGKIRKVKEDIYFSIETINDIKQKLYEFLQGEGTVSPSKFGELTGSSRKYNIPLLEYFDRERFTIRVGDQRVLRGSANSGARGKVD